MIPGQSQQFFEAAAAQAGAAGYEITRSLRFDSSSSSYLNRTPSSAGNRKTWTWSGWVKRGKLGTVQVLFANDNGAASNGHGEILFTSADRLYSSATDDNATSTYFLETSQLFRDASAWYHIVCSLDTSASVSSDRVSIYVNGVKVSAFSTATYPSQNYDGPINRNTSTSIGGILYTGGAGLLPFDGYLADVHFIDGQALAASDFGEYDDNNVWQPKAYSGGSYGTNGFYLKFADNSSNSALGTDSSGNNNDWTPNNLVAEQATTLPGVSFDGSGDFLTIPDNADFEFDGDFTLECFVNLTSTSSAQAPHPW